MLALPALLGSPKILTLSLTEMLPGLVSDLSTKELEITIHNAKSLTNTLFSCFFIEWSQTNTLLPQPSLKTISVQAFHQFPYNFHYYGLVSSHYS